MPSDSIGAARPQPTVLYHFTSIQNVSNIVASGGLLCTDDATGSGKCQQGIAHLDIKSKRRLIDVDVAPGGRLSSFVPFYFARRQPMMYSIAQGNVANVPPTQDPLVYFVTSVERIILLELAWVFCDRHVLTRLRRFFSDLPSLDSAIDWQVMRLRVWRAIESDPDRSARRQAEFDVQYFVPLEAFTLAVARTVAVGDRLRAELSRSACDLPVEVHNDDEWYFKGYP